MKLFFLSVLCSFNMYLQAQEKIVFPEAKFKTGDNPEWKNPGFDDSQWSKIKTNANWELQGYPDYNGYAWYRIHFNLSSALKQHSYWKDSLRVYLAKIDDAGVAYLNGVKIGQTGSLADDPEGYVTAWNTTSEFHLAHNNPAIRWDGDNVLAVRVYDGGGGGGIFGSVPFISMMDLIDAVKMNLTVDSKKSQLIVENSSSVQLNGQLTVRLYNPEYDTIVRTESKRLLLKPNQTIKTELSYRSNQRLSVKAVFKELHTGKTVEVEKTVPYILTPTTAAAPRINGAKVLGARPSSPILYRIAATGKKPLLFEVEHLPNGLLLDKEKGIISGVLTSKGDYHLQIKVSNSIGNTSRDFTIKVSDVLALTPPMGWNSWNCWGLSVSTEKVKASAQALIDKGLADHGWTYINIDDGWEQPHRDADSNVMTNSKFPDMKLLGDWLHNKGLKFGIYSSPGPLTCGGYLGSYKNELQDATMYNKWGIDYLKYDWCSYGDIAGKDTSLEAYQKPYIVMRDALKRQPRDIVFSLCQYGMKKVWEWGATVNGNCWRTTGDIEDTWESLSSIGFGQTDQYPYAGPGRWNDPDMLIVGMVGWGEHLHPTRLTPDEQYTHISLWCLLSAPLLIGCDISKMDDFTLGLLTNDEVIDIDQDIAGHQAKQVFKNEQYSIWIKELEDGSKAVGFFNLMDQYQQIDVNWESLGIKNKAKIRDVWRQQNIGFTTNARRFSIPPHGVKLVVLR